MESRNRYLVLASLPAAAAGIYNLGVQIRTTAGGPIDAWQLALLARLGIGEAASDPFAAIATGLIFWLPLALGCLAVSFGWATLFARVQDAELDPACLPAAWLFALILPASAPPVLAAIALTFGLVFGCYAFGGTGRYIVHPALLAIVFLELAYPGSTAPDALLPGGGALATWALVAATGVDAAEQQGIELLAAFVGNEVGAIGTTSALACLAGAAYLLAVRVAAAPIIAGGLLGLIGAAAAGASLPWTWQLALGNFAFALAFLATDTTTRPQTLAGRWLFGAAFGVLTIALRTANPAHPEASWAALLLAALCIPLIDHIVITLAPAAQAPRDA